jgi:hypothetical protein
MPDSIYKKYNWCSRCRLKFPKEMLVCSDCHNRLRTHTQRSKQIARLKIERQQMKELVVPVMEAV